MKKLVLTILIVGLWGTVGEAWEESYSTSIHPNVEWIETNLGERVLPLTELVDTCIPDDPRIYIDPPVDTIRICCCTVFVDKPCTEEQARRIMKEVKADKLIDSTPNYIIYSKSPPRALDDTFCVLTIYYVETVDVKLVEHTAQIPCPDNRPGCLVLHWGKKKFIEPILEKTVIREISMPCTEVSNNISLQVSFGLPKMVPILDTLFEGEDYFKGDIDTVVIDDLWRNK